MGVGRGKIDNTFILVKSMNSALTNSKFQPSNDHVQMTSLSKLIFIVIFSLPHFCLYAFLNCFCDTVPCLLSQRLSVHRLVEHEVRLLMKVSQQDQLAQVTVSLCMLTILSSQHLTLSQPTRYVLTPTVGLQRDQSPRARIINS